MWTRTVVFGILFLGALVNAGCTVPSPQTEPLKLLVALYIYPGTAWNPVITAQSSVNVIAIVNPDNGPGTSVDPTYTTWIANLVAAGITVVGYVHTSYGSRALSAVEADVATWHSFYSGLSGIFVDEAATSSSYISPYYSPLYTYITTGGFGYSQVILNPGTVPDSGYLAVSTAIVIFEDAGSNLPGATFPSWITCPPSSGLKYHFGGIANSVTSSSLVLSYLNDFASAGFGLVYVTDTYTALPSYFTTEVSDLHTINT